MSRGWAVRLGRAHRSGATVVLVLALGAFAGAARGQAQTSPVPPPANASAEPAPAHDAPFVLREIRLPRTLAVAEEEVLSVVAPYLRRAVGQTEMNLIAADIRRLYDARGLGLVSIGLTAQDLSSGALEVNIVEPRIHQILVELLGSPPPITEARTRQVLDNLNLRAEQSLNLNLLDRAMFTLNDWPGVKARATLAPTGDEGAYNLVLVVEAGSKFDGSVEYDNHGSASSGRQRLGGLLRWNNPLGVGDNLDLRALISSAQRVTVGRLAYELPVGATPWRLGAGYSRVTYELGGTFSLLGAVGSADIVDVSVSYPLLRARDHNLASRVALESKRLEDRFDAVNVQSNKRIDDLQFGLSFEVRDAVYGGGFSGGSVGLQIGRLGIDTPDVNASDAALGDRATQGQFTKLSAQFTRLQAITRTVSGFVGVAGQWASKNLDNAEKLTLGGAKGVRSYPGGEAPSDQGLLVNTELRWWIDPTWTAFGFYDWGYGGLQKRPMPGSDNKRILRGAGLGVQFSKPEILSFKASLGWRGAEPVLSEPGDDHARFLIQAQKPF